VASTRRVFLQDFETGRQAMSRWSIGRPNVSNIIVTVALVTVFGTGTAAAALVVRSTNIVDGEVKTVDLANGAVTTNKIAANAVTGAKIDESSLGIVPNADMLDGRDSTSFVTGPGRVISSWNGYSHGDSVFIFDWGTVLQTGFNIAARCSSDQIYVKNVQTADLDIWYRHNGGDAVYRRLTYEETFTFTEPDGPHMVTVHVVQPSTGRQQIVEYSVREEPPPAHDGWGMCITYGEAVLNF
jgi:hypothetical protein